MDRPTGEEITARLAEPLRHVGPFTDYKKDQPLLTDVLAWIDGDWQRLRTLLNLVHESGITLGTQRVQSLAAEYEHTSRHRQAMWIDDIQNPEESPPS